MKTNKPMLCPLCKSVLVVNGQERLETLGERVCRPNDEVCLKDRYVCSNESCTSHLHKICWERDGERYGFSTLPTARYDWMNPQSIFINNNPSPFNSMWRRINNEERRDGDEYYVLPMFTKKLGFIIKASKWRMVDEEDVVLEFGTRYSILTRQGEICDNPHYGINGWHMFVFSIKQHFRDRKYKLNCDKPFVLKYRGTMDEGAWWRSLSYKIKYAIEKYWYKTNPEYKKEESRW